MSSITAVDDHRAASRVDQPTTPAAALTALGIVYGDLGTSPLYTLNAVVQTFGGKLSPAAALGSLSLIVWLLIITISIKYCLFVMRADQHGEGGILVLMSLTGASWHGRGRAIIVMGLFGAALLYGDGIVTPAISVLRALEGLNVATDFFKPHVMPMAVAILVVLFAVQSRGTARIGWAFGPVMLVWFVTIAVRGLSRRNATACASPASSPPSTRRKRLHSSSTIRAPDSWCSAPCSWRSPAARPFMRTWGPLAANRSGRCGTAWCCRRCCSTTRARPPIISAIRR